MTEEKGLVTKYFVLNPHKETPHGRASRVAMIAYAHVIEKHDPQLASDLRDWVNKLDIKDDAISFELHVT